VFGPNAAASSASIGSRVAPPLGHSNASNIEAKIQFAES
jgi:hypothetical protein